MTGRIQLALNVDDLDQSVVFYSKLFGADCCYARQDKFWVEGAPNGERWEIYTVLEDSQTFWGEDASQADPGTRACCGGAAERAVTADSHDSTCC